MPCTRNTCDCTAHRPSQILPPQMPLVLSCQGHLLHIYPPCAIAALRAAIAFPSQILPPDCAQGAHSASKILPPQMLRALSCPKHLPHPNPPSGLCAGRTFRLQKSSLRNCSGHYRAPSNCPSLIHTSDCAQGAHSASKILPSQLLRALSCTKQLPHIYPPCAIAALRAAIAFTLPNPPSAIAQGTIVPQAIAPPKSSLRIVRRAHIPHHKLLLPVES